MDDLPSDILREIGFYLTIEDIEIVYRCLSRKFLLFICNDRFYMSKLQWMGAIQKYNVVLTQAKQVCLQEYLTQLREQLSDLEDDHICDKKMKQLGASISKLSDEKEALQKKKSKEDARKVLAQLTRRIDKVKRDKKALVKEFNRLDHSYKLRIAHLKSKIERLRQKCRKNVVEPIPCCTYTSVSIQSGDYVTSNPQESHVDHIINMKLFDDDNLGQVGHLGGICVDEGSLPWLLFYSYFDVERMMITYRLIHLTHGSYYSSELAERMRKESWSSKDLQKAYGLPFDIIVKDYF